jgi:hypothetical protein
MGRLTTKKSSADYLIISDLQVPFEAEYALEFCLSLKKQCNIADENVLCVGDEVDQYFGSCFPKDPDVAMSAVDELNITKKKLKQWYKAFPKMKLAISNHGIRWAKKAVQAEIPSQMIKAYQEVLEAPAGWVWKDEWIIKAEAPFKMIHGMGYSGPNAFRQAPIDHHMSIVFGHLHSHAGIAYLKTGVNSNATIWGMNVGSLIDTSSFAFHYGKHSRHKPILSVGLVLESGRCPLIKLYEED